MAPDSRPTPPLNLKRRFALTSLAVIVIIALGLGWLLREDKVVTSEVEGEIFVKLV